jgi:prephenate dehydrogenase
VEASVAGAEGRSEGSSVRRLAVVGTGLIGASVGLGAKRAGVELVTGYDSDPQALRVATERGAVDAAAGGLAECVEEADLVVVATPVASLATQVAAVLATTTESCTVTDVGSTKSGVCAVATDRTRFIGGHPVCGSEARGPAHASAEVFQGAIWFLTPLTETEPARYRLVHGFAASLGAVPVAIDPHAHDRLVALTSHLPHALANVLVNQAGAARIEGYDPLAGAGGSLRDMTRIAGANPRIWVDIFLENRSALTAALGEQRRRIEQLEAALAEGDAAFLARWIGEAAGNRRRMLETAYEDAGALHRLRVHVPDRPGVLAGIFQALGAERINVADFDLEHFSTERGGTLTLLVSGEATASLAARGLEAQGYGVVVAPVDEA